MKILAGSRQNGKSTKIINYWLNDIYGVLVVLTNNEAKKLRTLYDGKVISAYEYKNKRDGFNPNSVYYFDNIELILDYILGIKIGAISLCGSGPASLITTDDIKNVHASLSEYQFQNEYPVEFENGL
jgi:hypothetical protein